MQAIYLRVRLFLTSTVYHYWWSHKKSDCLVVLYYWSGQDKECNARKIQNADDTAADDAVDDYHDKEEEYMVLLMTEKNVCYTSPGTSQAISL